MDEPPRDNCIALNALVILILDLLCADTYCIGKGRKNKSAPNIISVGFKKAILYMLRRIHSPNFSVLMRI